MKKPANTRFYGRKTRIGVDPSTFVNLAYLLNRFDKERAGIIPKNPANQGTKTPQRTEDESADKEGS